LAANTRRAKSFAIESGRYFPQKSQVSRGLSEGSVTEMKTSFKPASKPPILEKNGFSAQIVLPSNLRAVFHPSV
jgi:hypothetical protein